jgi:hypothetical protein
LAIAPNSSILNMPHPPPSVDPSIGVARICRGGSGSFCQKFQILTVNLKKNSGERNFTVNFKDFFPKGGRVVRSPQPPCLRLCGPLAGVPTTHFRVIRDLCHPAPGRCN